jgi:segregation and condensation protein A
VEVSEEEDPRAELVRRLQEYERFKRAAEDIDGLPRLERDVFPGSAEITERKVVNIVPTVSLQEMLLAFKDVIQRAAMFASHHVARERLSVRQRMSEMLQRLQADTFIDFIRLFEVSEGRMGVTVTFVALLELLREGLVEFVQAEAYGPIHVRPATAPRDWSEAVTPDVDSGEGNLVLALEPVFEEPIVTATAVSGGTQMVPEQEDEPAPVRAPVVDNGF